LFEERVGIQESRQKEGNRTKLATWKLAVGGWGHGSLMMSEGGKAKGKSLGGAFPGEKKDVKYTGPFG